MWGGVAVANTACVCVRVLAERARERLAPLNSCGPGCAVAAGRQPVCRGGVCGPVGKLDEIRTGLATQLDDVVTDLIAIQEHGSGSSSGIVDEEISLPSAGVSCIIL